MNIKQGELHVWRYKVNENDYIAEKINPVLSNKEKERAGRFINQSDSIRYIVNHRFIRIVLADYLNIEPNYIQIEYGPFGKPFIKGRITFNTSSRNQYGLLAISVHNEVGVDIEQLREIDDVLSFVSLYFSENERAAILSEENNNQINRIFFFWTLKEALVKAQGKCVSSDFGKIDLANSIHKQPFIFGNDEKHMYELRNIYSKEEYIAAVAMQGNIEQYLEFDYE
jgi:4'-phosphopantetheinyl transferase